VSLSFSQPDVESVVEGDEELLRRLIMNLLDNAIKYTMPGGMVTVQLIQLPTECVLMVQDTGRGIAIEAQPYIFERFFREDKARRRNVESEGSVQDWVFQSHSGLQICTAVTLFSRVHPRRQYLFCSVSMF